MTRQELLKRSFIFSMNEEGKSVYTNDKRDSGGPTKWGIALNYNRDIIPDKDGNGIINAEDIKRLTENDALIVYEERYWKPNIKPEYPDALAFMLADMCLNPGPGITPKLLQRALDFTGKDVDGKIGKRTLAAIASADLKELLPKLADYRFDYYESRPAFPVYGKGWTARTNRCLKEALKILKETE